MSDEQPSCVCQSSFTNHVKSPTPANGRRVVHNTSNLPLLVDECDLIKSITPSVDRVAICLSRLSSLSFFVSALASMRVTRRQWHAFQRRHPIHSACLSQPLPYVGNRTRRQTDTPLFPGLRRRPNIKTTLQRPQPPSATKTTHRQAMR